MRKGQKGPVHTTPKEFENEGFLCKRNNVDLRKNLGREITWRRRFPKPPFPKARPAFSNSSGLNSVLEKFRFREGLMWKTGLTVAIKMRFQISPT